MKTVSTWAMALLLALNLYAEPLGAQESHWRLDAVRFATSKGLIKSRLVVGADDRSRTEMGWYFFVARRGDRTILIDAGTDVFTEESKLGNQRRRGWAIEEARGVVEALGALGIVPSEVTDVLVTHHHWDHSEGLVHFPGARIHIHEREWRALVRSARGERLKKALDTALGEGRVVRFDDEGSRLAPGLGALVSGRHTRGFASVSVRCSGGTHVIAGDSAYLFENIARRRAVTIATDARGNIADIEGLGRLTSGSGVVLPGHDNALFERFPSKKAGVASICR